LGALQSKEPEPELEPELDPELEPLVAASGPALLLLELHATVAARAKTPRTPIDRRCMNDKMD
jgi:hypothetical protein